MSCPSRACKFLMVPGLFLSLNILLNPVCFAGFLGLLCACVAGVGGGGYVCRLIVSCSLQPRVCVC